MSAAPSPVLADVAVLVVAVGEDIAASLSEPLQRVGAETEVVADLASAVDRIARRRPDVIIVDDDIGGGRGSELVAPLKADPATATIPVIRRAAEDADAAAVSDEIRWGADAVVTSPLDPRLLLAHVEAVVRQRDLSRQLEVALSSGDTGVFDWNVGTGTVRWSGSLEAIHGLDPGGFEGTVDAFLTFVHADDRDEVTGALDDIVHGPDEEFTLEFRFVRTDRSVGHMQSRGRLFRDLGGAPARVLGLAQDVTRSVVDRSQTDQLRRLGSRLAGLRTTAGVMAAVVDEIGTSGASATLGSVAEPRPAGTVFSATVDDARRLDVGWASQPDGISRRQTIAIGELAASAIDRAIRYETERSNAQALQRALHPTPTVQVDGYRVDAEYVPASSTDRLGGDFLDLLVVDEAIIVTIGDVAGHGLPATVQMGSVRAMLRTLTARHGEHPARVLELARQLFPIVCGDDAPFVTALQARIDISSGRVDVATAGHPPAVVGRAGGDVELVAPKPAPPLGVPSAGEPATESITLGSGDWLLVYTDGVFETRNTMIDDAVRAGAARLGPGAPTTDEVLDVGDDADARTSDDRALVIVARA